MAVTPKRCVWATLFTSKNLFKIKFYMGWDVGQLDALHHLGAPGVGIGTLAYFLSAFLLQQITRQGYTLCKLTSLLAEGVDCNFSWQLCKYRFQIKIFKIRGICTSFSRLIPSARRTRIRSSLLCINASKLWIKKVLLTNTFQNSPERPFRCLY